MRQWPPTKEETTRGDQSLTPRQQCPLEVVATAFTTLQVVVVVFFFLFFSFVFSFSRFEHLFVFFLLCFFCFFPLRFISSSRSEQVSFFSIVFFFFYFPSFVFFRLLALSPPSFFFYCLPRHYYSFFSFRFPPLPPTPLASLRSALQIPLRFLHHHISHTYPGFYQYFYLFSSFTLTKSREGKG